MAKVTVTDENGDSVTVNTTTGEVTDRSSSWLPPPPDIGDMLYDIIIGDDTDD